VTAIASPQRKNLTKEDCSICGHTACVRWVATRTLKIVVVGWGCERCGESRVIGIV
jgi:hypothetical protein